MQPNLVAVGLGDHLGACLLVKQGYELSLGGAAVGSQGTMCAERGAVPGTRTLPWGREMRVSPVYQGERGGRRAATEKLPGGPVLLA